MRLFTLAKKLKNINRKALTQRHEMRRPLIIIDVVCTAKMAGSVAPLAWVCDINSKKGEHDE